MDMNLTDKSVSQIAGIIRADWTQGGKKVYFGAVPYLDAMRSMDKVTDDYFADSGPSVIRYFLANATTWKGEVARAVKAELNKRIKGVY